MPPASRRSSRWRGSLARQEPPLPAKDIEEIVGHRPHPALLAGPHVSRQERDPVARACGGSLCGLAGGPKRKPPIAEPARKPRGFGNEAILLVEADERRLVAGIEPVAIGRR